MAQTLPIVDYPAYGEEWVKVQQALAANGIILAGPKCKYTTVQAAVDAAAADYAADGSWQVAEIKPGVTRSFDEAQGVLMHFSDTPRTTRIGGYKRIVEARNGEPPWQVWDPSTMIAIVVDDGKDQAVTADALWGGITFSQYCWERGIIANHAIVPDLIGTDGYMTADELLQIRNLYGAAFCSHGNSHAATPATPAAAMEALFGARYELEHLTSEAWTTPGKRFGEIIRGWRQPGDWAGDGYFDTPAEADNWLGQLVRSCYEWYMGYGGVAVGSGAMPASFPQCINLNAQNSAGQYVFDDLARAKAALVNQCYPGGRMAFLAHDVNDATEGARLKNLIDAIVAIRTDRTTYPRTCIQSVSLDTLMLATQSPPQYIQDILEPEGMGALIVPHQGPGAYLRWDQFADDASLANNYTDFVAYPLWKISLSGTATARVRAQAGGALGKYLELVGGTANASLGLMHSAPVGRRYKLVFHANFSAGASNSVRINVQANAPGGVTYNLMNTAVFPMTPGSWQWYEVPFAYPDFAMKFMYCMIRAWTGDTVLVDRVSVVPA